MNETTTGEEWLTDGESVVAVRYEGCVGAARCHPDDEFDFIIGFNLAKARALEKRAQFLQAHAKGIRRMAYRDIYKKEKQ